MAVVFGKHRFYADKATSKQGISKYSGRLFRYFKELRRPGPVTVFTSVFRGRLTHDDLLVTPLIDCAEGDEPDKLDILRRNVNKNLPCGSEMFIRKLGKRAGCDLQYQATWGAEER